MLFLQVPQIWFDQRNDGFQLLNLTDVMSAQWRLQSTDAFYTNGSISLKRLVKRMF